MTNYPVVRHLGKEQGTPKRLRQDDERPGSLSLKFFEMDRLVLKGDLSYLVAIIEELFLIVQERMVDGQACNGGNFVEGKIEAIFVASLNMLP